MGQTDPSMARLKIILTILGIMLILSVMTSFLLDTETNYDDVVETFEGDDLATSDIDYSKGGDEQDVSLDPIGLIYDIAAFFIGIKALTFLELPAYMSAIVIPIYILLIATFWYLVLDFLKDITVLGSHI